jgi:hypothetical protein
LECFGLILVQTQKELSLLDEECKGLQ